MKSTKVTRKNLVALRVLRGALSSLTNCAYPEEAGEEKQKNLFQKKRSHDRPITFSHLPELTAGIGTLRSVAVRPSQVVEASSGRSLRLSG